MAKNEQILRLKYIETLLRNRKERGASYEEIEEYLQKKFAENDTLEELKFSKKTWERDQLAISEIMKIEISYSRKKNAYYISDEELENAQENVFDNLLLIQAYRETKNKTDIMFFEQRTSRGLQNLHGLVHAIINKKLISVNYRSFSTESEQKIVLEPYALKEFKYRWYLLANEFKRDASRTSSADFSSVLRMTPKIKSYGLDRISDLEIKNSSFKRQKYDVAEEYKNLFGIVSKNEHQLEEIILSFDANQGQYVKSLPFHHSQEVLVDDENELRIKLKLYPTYDFKQEILMHGNRVKVIAPESFKKEIKEEIKQMLSNYS